jgi:hypothetical protein
MRDYLQNCEINSSSLDPSFRRNNNNKNERHPAVSILNDERMDGNYQQWRADGFLSFIFQQNVTDPAQLTLIADN